MSYSARVGLVNSTPISLKGGKDLSITETFVKENSQILSFMCGVDHHKNSLVSCRTLLPLESMDYMSEFLRRGLMCDIMCVIFRTVVLIFIVVSCNITFRLLYPAFFRCPLFISLSLSEKAKSNCFQRKLLKKYEHMILGFKFTSCRFLKNFL